MRGQGPASPREALDPLQSPGRPRPLPAPGEQAGDPSPTQPRRHQAPLPAQGRLLVPLQAPRPSAPRGRREPQGRGGAGSSLLQSLYPSASWLGMGGMSSHPGAQGLAQTLREPELADPTAGRSHPQAPWRRAPSPQCLQVSLRLRCHLNPHRGFSGSTGHPTRAAPAWPSAGGWSVGGGQGAVAEKWGGYSAPGGQGPCSPLPAAGPVKVPQA